MLRIRHFLSLAAVVAAVCSCGPPDDGVSTEQRKALGDANSLAMKVKGDYDKLTPEERKPILTMAHGDEERARRLCYLMANPPNRPRGGGPAGPGRPGSIPNQGSLGD